MSWMRDHHNNRNHPDMIHTRDKAKMRYNPGKNAQYFTPGSPQDIQESQAHDAVCPIHCHPGKVLPL